MSVIVGGGTGFIGRYVARLGVKKGFNVISVSRQARPNCLTWNDVNKNGLPDDCVAVVSMSGEPVLQPFKKWTDQMKKEIHNSRVEKTKMLQRAICQASNPPKVFVSFSGVGYYKPHDTKEYTEEDKVEPYDFLSELCTEWEGAATLPSTLQTRVVILRTGVVLGKDGGMVQSIKNPFYMGLGGPIGSGKQWFPWVHVEDIAGLVWHAIENEQVTGILNGTAPQPVRSCEFTKAYAAALWRPHLIPMTAFSINFMFGSEAGTMMLEGQNVQPKKALASGYQFLYPDVNSAVKELVSKG